MKLAQYHSILTKLLFSSFLLSIFQSKLVESHKNELWIGAESRGSALFYSRIRFLFYRSLFTITLTNFAICTTVAK